MEAASVREKRGRGAADRKTPSCYVFCGGKKLAKTFSCSDYFDLENLKGLDVL